MRYFKPTAVAVLLSISAILPVAAQSGRNVDPRVQLSFDRFYDHAQMTAALQKLVQAWPEFLSMQSLGKSVGGRDMWLVTVENRKTGDQATKAAMWIDANVHGNEVQGSEVCLYTLWYLMENYGKIERVTKLVDTRVFYVLPMVNPDGRDHWFHAANNSSSSRSGIAPIDSDKDGLFDEDPTDDLDGDGSIVQMRKKVERGGTHKIDPADARRMVRVKPGEEGDYVMLGSEGIDNDGDGQFNEDGPGGYDMNRSDPTDWQPEYIQFGAGPYPLYWPETRCIADFIAARPNIAAVQSYHNAGGMILRGPGAASVGEYPGEDVAVYDQLGKDGEYMLPYYRYMIIHKDLYTVHGGFVNWTAEGLGIISFTNELWNDQQYMNKPRAERGADFDFEGTAADRQKWDDLLMMGSQWVNWKKVTHPQYGEIEVGGWSKWSSRVPPAFMLPEMCHRNTVFTLNHAEAMPSVSIEPAKVESLGGKLKSITVTIKNANLIPTRTAIAAQKKIGMPDFVTLSGGTKPVAASFVREGFPRTTRTAIEKDLSRIRLESGIPSRGKTTIEWIVDGPGPWRIEYRSEKGGVHSIAVD